MAKINAGVMHIERFPVVRHPAGQPLPGFQTPAIQNIGTDPGRLAAYQIFVFRFHKPDGAANYIDQRSQFSQDGDQHFIQFETGIECATGQIEQLQFSIASDQGRFGLLLHGNIV